MLSASRCFATISGSYNSLSGCTIVAFSQSMLCNNIRKLQFSQWMHHSCFQPVDVSTASCPMLTTVSVKKFTCVSVRLEWSLDQLGRHINIVIIIIIIIIMTIPAYDDYLNAITSVSVNRCFYQKLRFFQWTPVCFSGSLFSKTAVRSTRS